MASPVMYTIIMTKIQRGLKPRNRKLATTVRPQAKKGKLTANQWQNTPQQHLFMDGWINPTSPTFGNAYESALAAHYSRRYALKLTAPTTLNQWIGEYRRKLDFGPEHIKQGLQQLAMRANDSKSPDDTRLKALEALMRVHNMDSSRGQTVNVAIVQPILGGSSVKKVDVEQ